MDKDEEKKQKKRDWGGTIANIVQWIKWLKNPIVFWTAIGILILLLIIGIIGFFTSIPGNVLGWLSDFVTGGEDPLKVTEGELYDLCVYLEEMGIDLESYGFVEEIERESAIETDGNTYKDDKPSKGEIKEGSIKSKYLTSYIRAEKKSYLFANPKDEIRSTWAIEMYKLFKEMLNLDNDSVEYNNFIKGQAALEVFNEQWSNGNVPPSEYKQLILNMYNDNGTYYNCEQTGPYQTIQKSELRTTIRTMIYIYYCNDQDDEAYKFGQTLIEQNTKFKEQFEEAIKTKVAKLEQQYSQADVTGSGLIFMENYGDDEGESEVEANSALTKATWYVDNIKYIAEIDKDNKYFIINMSEAADFLSKIVQILGIEARNRYAYDLNGWTTKYGKPVEFLLAMHLATQAPDFVYQVATSQAIDTKVHVDLFPVDVKFKFVLDDKGEQSLEELLEEINNSPEILAKYKSYIPQIESELKEHLVKLNNSSLVLKKNDEEIQKQVEDIINGLRNAGTIKDFIQKIASMLSDNAMEGPDNQYVSKTAIPTAIKVVDEKIIPITVGTETTYFSYCQVYKNLYFSNTISGVYLGQDNSIIASMNKYQSNTKTATPYITKVVQHWYRNQYFINEEVELSSIKQRIRTMLVNVYAYFQEIDPDHLGDGIIDETQVVNMSNFISDEDEQIIDSFSEIEKIKDFVTTKKDEWLDKAESEGKSDNTKSNIENEFSAVLKQLESNISGTAYQVKSNPDPIYYKLAESAEVSDDEEVNNFLRSLYMEETRSADLVQEHNPLFEDNSQYIRSWLKEKYYIFGTNPNKLFDKEDTNNVIKTFSNEKLVEGKKYINGKTALQFVDNMIEICDDRSDMIYMLRDLRELFQDFEFDLENTEVPAQKVLDNIMPSYKPYTSWPSVYEKSESNCTKMIYKTSASANIVAPADGHITKVGNGVIEIEFTDSEVEGMILNIKAEQGGLTCDKAVNDQVEKGKIIGRASSSNGMIILKLNMFSATKQLLKVEDYMTVERRTYNAENKEYRLSEEEKIQLYSLQESEIELETTGALWWAEETDVTISQRMALMNVIFNRIASPYYPNSYNVSSAISDSKGEDFLKYKRSTETLSKLEENSSAKYAIMNAMSGVDVTKTNTILGATRYFATDDEYYESIPVDKKEECLNKIEKLKTKTIVNNRVFGITEEEYLKYLGDILEKKLNEVIYELNIAHYIQGTEEITGINEEQEQVQPNDEQPNEQDRLDAQDKFESAKDTIIKYYTDEEFLEDCCATIPPAGAGTITNVVKSNVVPGEPDEQGNVVDEFLITVNSNYMVKWTFKYKVGEKGNVESAVEVEKSPIINY